MTTPASSLSSAPPLAQPTVELFYVITIQAQVAVDLGDEKVTKTVIETISNDISVQTGMPSMELFELVRGRLVPEPLRDGIVLHYSTHPRFVV
ncbi:hypothetical protein DQ384_05635 [Sphaerisporangium album]|uniref:Uncharacterized protein n=1 Tax=Sphaerisporangium album TaxID=509200 RepID=A0A367FP26_9ACTN|nr:hypothetical protein [Sphaerisporangium album]RCG32021.1 hypothetical protein DQ384_05635 [Sphaerisporangium album]